MAEENSSCVMVRQNHKQKYKGDNAGQEDMESIIRKKRLRWL